MKLCFYLLRNHLIVCLCIGTSFTLTGSVAQAADEAMNSKRSPSHNQVVQRLSAIHKRLDIPGLGFVLLDLSQSEKLIDSGTLGLANIANRTPLTPDHYFRIGSITKLMTGLAAKVAEQQTTLSLNDPLTKYLSPNHWDNPYKTAITLRMLLEHSAGLTDLSSQEMFDNAPYSLEQALKNGIPHRKVLWEPGLFHSYSNAGYGFVEHAIEQATKTPFHQFLQQQVLQPTGMQSADLLASDAVLKGLATGYDSDGQSVIPYWQMSFKSFGALNVRLSDMAALLELLVSEGRVKGKRVFPKALMADLTQPRTTLSARDGMAYGYGLGLYPFYNKGRLLYGHGGDGDGYLSFLGFSPESQRGFYVVINVFRKDKLNAVRQVLEDYLIEGVPRSQPPPPYKPTLDKGTIQALSGTYVSATYRFRPSNERIELFARGKKLFYSQNGRTFALIPVSEHLYRHQRETTATIMIARDGQDRWIFQYDDANYIKQ